LNVVGEVSDGSEAVQRVEELKPDLILMDIGLPSLNGIEAARRIHKLNPDSKIVFLSMEDDVDVVQEALGLGALGYIRKPAPAGAILAAVEAACQGKQYLSPGLTPPR